MRLLHSLTALLLFPLFTFANSNFVTEDDRQLFINRFVDIAVEEMGRTGIPASIKLAQAIVESGWGQGTIAEEANNFFCIKCYNGWQGPTFKEWDDEKEKSCFRKYETVIQSFIDHSAFLTDNPRYAPLFSIDRTDYKAWAYGLKKCGYATNVAYADKLIRIIEDYGLWVYDYAVPVSTMDSLDTEEIENETEEEYFAETSEPTPTIEPMTWQPTRPEPKKKISAPRVMEVPGYRKESLPPSNQRPNYQPEYQAPKSTRKIRPIMPLPNLDLSRR